MPEQRPLTSTDILSATTEELTKNGYQRIDTDQGSYWDSDQARLFEDEYGIVAVVVYETWKTLESEWFDAQAALVELISQYIKSTDPKAWEGYLLLLSIGYAPSAEAVSKIRYDMSRVRKLVADGQQLQTLSAIKRILKPLLPIVDEINLGTGETALDMLPRLLSSHGVSDEDVRVIVNSYRKGTPLIRELHGHLNK